MLPYFLLGVALLAGLILIAKWFVAAPPAKVATALRWTAGVLVAAVAVYLAVTGRLGAAVAAMVALGPIFMRWRAVLRRLRSAAGPAPGQASAVETAMLRMTLDHDSGTMTGEVLEGRFKGRRLDQLGRDELLDLFAECAAADPRSAAILEAYLDRQFGAEWRAAAAGAEAGGGRTGAMMRGEALEILGLDEGAGRDEIKAAYHRLMLKLHPDHGGSTYLATKINQAKDVLLGAR